MRHWLPASLLILACAACSPRTPPIAGAPNGDVINRTSGTAPDTPPGLKDPKGFHDNSVDTDPNSPRYHDRRQPVSAPLITE
jgi:hypothetical protein